MDQRGAHRLNIGQLPASFILARRCRPAGAQGVALYRLRRCFALSQPSALFSAPAPGSSRPPRLQGFAAAAILILVLALPPLLSPPDDVHRVTAAMFTISYSCAVIVPVISGMVWDLSGIAALAFLPIALCGILLVILAPGDQSCAGHAGAEAMRAIPVGAKGTYSLRVMPAHLANQFKDASLPQVFATPMMVTAMENAALNAVRDYLDPGESCVGTRGECAPSGRDAGRPSRHGRSGGHQSRRPPHRVQRQRARRRSKRSATARTSAWSSTWPASISGWTPKNARKPRQIRIDRARASCLQDRLRCCKRLPTRNVRERKCQSPWFAEFTSIMKSSAIPVPSSR